MPPVPSEHWPGCARALKLPGSLAGQSSPIHCCGTAPQTRSWRFRTTRSASRKPFCLAFRKSMFSTRLNIRFTLKQLQYFAAVARTGQISLAAAEVNVSQSAMTAAVAELERVLGTLLFERGRSGVALTHDGHLFLN